MSSSRLDPATHRTGPEQPTRRTALAVGAAVTASATGLLVAGCSVTYEPLPAAPENTDAATPGSGGPVDSASPGPATTGVMLGPASDVPVGGGTVYDAEEIVVTQPDAGNYKAFSAICTHMRCLVSKVSDGTIYCPCHGSKFNITDGSVVLGPATVPLPARQVADDGGTLRMV